MQWDQLVKSSKQVSDHVKVWYNETTSQGVWGAAYDRNNQKLYQDRWIWHQRFQNRQEKADIFIRVEYPA